MKLSKRLEMAVSFSSQGKKIADVGTDHGYVPIALVERDAEKRVIAMDIRPGPLERAREHVRHYGLEDKIEIRLSDGVKELSAQEADTIVIAGMGGELVIHILEEGQALWESVRHWILSPQSDLDKVRRYLEAQGFDTEKEDMVEEDGKYYTFMDVVWKGGLQKRETRKKTESSEEADYLYGADLIRMKHPVLMEFLKKEKRQTEAILEELEGKTGEKAVERKAILSRKLLGIQETIDKMKTGRRENHEMQ